MDIQRCFQILEIDMKVSLQEIKKARNDLIFIWHPDRIPSENQRLKKRAEEKLKDINIAYETIRSFLESSLSIEQSRGYENPDVKPKHSESVSKNIDQADIYLKKGITYGESHQYRQSIKCFSKAIQLDPSNADAYYNRGIVYNNKDKYKLAIKDFTQAIRIDPNYAFAYIYRGYIYAELDRFDLACNDFRHAYQLGNNIGMEWAKNEDCVMGCESLGLEEHYFFKSFTNSFTIESTF